MKLLSAVWISVKNNIRNSFFLYAFILLGVCFSLSTHFISVAFVGMSSSAKNEYATYNTVSVMDVSELSEEKVQKIKERNVANVFFIPDSNDSPMIIGWYGKRPANWFPLGEGSFDMSEPLNAYVSSDIATFSSDKENTVSVLGKEYKVTGSGVLWLFNFVNGIDDRFAGRSVTSFVIVPISEIVGIGGNSGCLRIQFVKYTGEDLAFVQSLFQENEIVPPLNNDSGLENIYYLVPMGIICMLSYINIIVSYWYLLKRQKNEYAVYRILGATDRQMRAILVIKYIMLYLSGFILSLVILAMSKPLLSMLCIEIWYDPVIILITFMIDMVATLLISVPQINSILSSRGGTAALRRGVDV